MANDDVCLFATFQNVVYFCTQLRTTIYSLNTADLSDMEGVLEKKGLGALIRPWTKRKFRFHEPLKILYYYDEQDELKGAVVLDDSKPIELVSHEISDGKPFSFRLRCRKAWRSRVMIDYGDRE